MYKRSIFFRYMCVCDSESAIGSKTGSGRGRGFEPLSVCLFLLVLEFVDGVEGNERERTVTTDGISAHDGDGEGKSTRTHAPRTDFFFFFQSFPTRLVRSLE